MCVTRVGKILSIDKAKATVKLVGDDRVIYNVDISMLNPKLNSYVEVYANLAISRLSAREAESRRKVWLEVMQSKS